MSDKEGWINSMRMYQILEIPDVSCWQSQIMAGGDVCSAVFAGWESLARQISHRPSGSVSVEVLYVFNPQCQGYDKQSRLKLYLGIQSCNEGITFCKDPERNSKD